MGPSLTSRGLADRAGLVVRDLVGRVDLVVRDLVGLAVLVRVDPVDLADLDRDRGQAGPVDQAVLGRVDLADIRDRADLVVLDLAGLGDPAGLDPVGLVVLDPVDLADRVGLVDPVDLTDIKDPVDLAVLDPAGREDLGSRAWTRRAGRTWGSRWAAAVHTQGFLRAGWPPDGRPQGCASRLQRTRPRCAASTPRTRIRLEWWASPRSAAAFLGRTAASGWLGRSTASRWLEQPMERSGA